MGRPKYYGSRYRSSLGNLYTGFVIEAWNSGRITNHSAAEYMGIKNFEHLFAIRDRITVIVSDRGPGMPNVHLKSVFLPFYRVKVWRRHRIGPRHRSATRRRATLRAR